MFKRLAKLFSPKKNPLQGLFTLEGQVTIYVPSTTGIDQETDTQAFVDSFLTSLSKMFGGATAEKVQGAWVSDTKGLVKEGITKVYAFAEPTELDANLSAIIAQVKEMKDQLSQDAVGIEVNGKFYLV